jgi:biotin carboxyl carrier protein
VIEAAARTLSASGGSSPWSALTGFRLNGAARYEARLEDAAGVHAVTIDPQAPPPAVCVAKIGAHIVAFEAGAAYAFTAPKAGAASGDVGGEDTVRSPMPGKVVAVHAAKGDKVERGQPLITLEAMKMEHVLIAPISGVVEALNVASGEQVSEGVALAKLAPS